VGTFPAQFICDRYGRRWVMVFGAVMCIAAALVQTFSYSSKQYIAGRFLMGFGISPSIVGASSLVNELAHPRQRPFIGASFNVIWYLGSIIAAWLNYGLASGVTSSWQWRGPSLGQVVPSLFIISVIFFIPESPRWLISKGREEEAHAILAKYHANGDAQDPLVNGE
jgi:MFS family permease